MQLLMLAAVVILLIGLGTRSRWDRLRRDIDHGIKEWMLAVPGLERICRDYLGLIKQMKSGQHDRETVHHPDSQRQVAPDQILGNLELDRSATLDVEAFAKRYFERA